MSKLNDEAMDSIPKVVKDKKGVHKLDSVPKKIREEVDIFLEEKDAEEKSKKAALKAKESVLKYITPLFDQYGESGNYQKSFRVPGETKDGVTVTKASRFSIDKDMTIEDLVKIAGKKFVESNFEQEISVAVNPAVLSDPKRTSILISRLRKAFGAELKDYFVQEKNIVVADGVDLAENIYSLPEKKRESLKAVVKQAAPGFR